MWGFFALLCFGFGLDAWAAGGATAGSTLPGYQMKSLEDVRAQNLDTCGVGCDYEQANAKLSLEGFYIHQKLTELDALADDILKTKDDDKRQQLKAKLNANFPGHCQGIDALDCFERYGAAETKRLSELHGSILKNADVQVRLITPTNATPGAIAVRPQAAEGYVAPPPIKPYLPTDAEFEAENKLRVAELKTQQRLSSTDYQEWLKNYPKPPSCDTAFVKTRKVPRDPDDPTREQLEIPVLDVKGNPVVDKAACVQAQAAYIKRLQIANDERDRLFKEYGPGSPVDLATIQTIDQTSTQQAFKTARDAFAGRLQAEKNDPAKGKARGPAKVGGSQELKITTTVRWNMESMRAAIRRWEKRFLGIQAPPVAKP